MINESKPMAHSSWHIDIQHFAIQEWQDCGEIEMQHIPGIINPADDETKALSWVIRSRHSHRAMGHYGPPNLGREWFKICLLTYAAFRIHMWPLVLLGSREGVAAYDVPKYWTLVFRMPMMCLQDSSVVLYILCLYYSQTDVWTDNDGVLFYSSFLHPFSSPSSQLFDWLILIRLLLIVGRVVLTIIYYYSTGLQK